MGRKSDSGGRTYKTYGYFDEANAYCNPTAIASGSVSGLKVMISSEELLW